MPSFVIALSHFRHGKLARRWGMTVGLITVLISIGGCGNNKLSQCKRLILVTQNISEASAQYRDSTEQEEVLQIADQFETTATNVGKLNLNDLTLQGYQQQLVEIYQGNAEATRNMIAAIASKDILTAQLAQKQVTTIGQQEQQVITDINRYCRTP